MSKLTLPGGAVVTAIPISKLFCLSCLQRPVRKHQINRFRKRGPLDFQALLVLGVVPGEKINKKYKGMFHVAEGHTRLAWIEEEFPTGYYTEDDEKAGRIPEGCKVREEVTVPCSILDRDPVYSFEVLNDNDRAKEAQKYNVRKNGGKGYDPEKQVAHLLDFHGINTQVDGCIKHPNTTKAAHILVTYWKVNPAIVSGVLDILNGVYRHRDIYDSKALTRPFLEALCNLLKEGSFDAKMMTAALARAYSKGETAEAIVATNIGTGSGPSRMKVECYIRGLVVKYGKR